MFQCLVEARGQRVSVSCESKGAACFSVFMKARGQRVSVSSESKGAACPSS